MTFRRAAIWRRVLASAIDALPAAFAGVVCALVVAQSPYSAPAGWFQSEWLLKIWLDTPRQFLAPAAVFVATWVGWSFVWEGVRSTTPGGRLLGNDVVTSRGRPMSWGHALLRSLGTLLEVATLGLGAAWAIADPEGRALHDRISGTWVVERPT